MRNKPKIAYCVLALLILISTVAAKQDNNQQRITFTKALRVKVAKNEASSVLVRQMVKDDEQAKDCLASEHNNNPALLGGKLEVRRLDLNLDGKPELIVQLSDACPGGHNSPIFVYRRTSKGYILLLKDSGTDLSTRKAMTGGYRDLTVVAHGSAIDHEITFYKFSRGKYRESRRFNEKSK